MKLYLKSVLMTVYLHLHIANTQI